MTIPPHLTTREFNRLVRERLGPRGFYVINLIDARQGPGLLPSLVTTLERDFAEVSVWLDEDSWPSPGRVTYGIVSTDAPLEVQSLRVSDGSRRAWRRLPHAGLGDLADALVLSDDYAPVDRLMQRVTLDASLMGE